MSKVIVAAVLLVSAAAAAKVCYSDFDCDYGSACVKGQFEVKGFCAKKVDDTGLPTYTPPDPDSVGPGGEGNCQFNTDCPVGFKCWKEAGKIYGYCMK